MNKFNKVCLSPKPVESLKNLVTGAVNYNQLEILMNLEYNKTITEVSNSFEVDIFFVGLDNHSVFKLDTTFLYAVHDVENFNFIMIPEADVAAVIKVNKFIKEHGVSVVVEVPRLLGKKYYTVDSLQTNIKRVVNFSGYVKHIDIDFNHPVAIVNDLLFRSEVVFRGDYYLLELPTEAAPLSKHLANYTSVYNKKLMPVAEDKHGYFEYSEPDFKFITRLVLQHHFDPKRIAEAFRLPSEAFIGSLVKQYRYKVGNIESMSYDDAKHDIKPYGDYYDNSLAYNSNRFNSKKVS